MVLVSVGDSYLFHSPMFHQVLSGLLLCIVLDLMYRVSYYLLFMPFLFRTVGCHNAQGSMYCYVQKQVPEHINYLYSKHTFSSNIDTFIILLNTTCPRIGG